MKLLKGAGVAVLLAFTGCVESTTYMTVEKDGSGTIVLQEYYSPQLMQMMDGMGGMASGMMQGMTEAVGAAAGEGAASNGAAASIPKPDFLTEAAKGKAEKFGPGVVLVAQDSRSNKAGWKGFCAKYKFTDVNKITVKLGDMEQGGEGSSQGKTSMGGDSVYGFKFTAGDPATLEIIQSKKEKKPAAGGADASKLADAAGTNTAQITMDAGAPGAAAGQGMEQMGGEMMKQMAGPMLKGMRMTFLVKVNGTIDQTNAKHRHSTHPDTVIVTDMAMDSLLANKEASDLMFSEAADRDAKLAALTIPGLQMEPPDKIIRISFK
jgi:hypothetical protein